MGWSNDNFFEEIGWAPSGFNKDGTPWYLIPPEVLRFELALRGFDVSEDRGRRTQPLNWGEIMADMGHRQDVCLLKKPFMTITADMLEVP